MSRLIDADALMVELMDSDLDHLQRDDWREVIQIVTDAPTIAPEPHWIPVEQALPEDERNVLITYYDEITVGWYRASEDTWLIYEGDANVEPEEVTAWMPLPEPYRGEEK